jgi:hypothetical protein
VAARKAPQKGVVMNTCHRSLRRLVAGVGVAAAAGLATPAPAVSVLHVDDDAPPGGDGSGWATACRFLQDALSFAANPDHGVTEIWIAQGTYRPDQDDANPTGTGDREASFPLVGGVALLGGYAGLGTPNPDARDLVQYETVLSGDLNADDGPGGANNEDNSYTVVAGANVDTVASLDGLTFAGGNANAALGQVDPRCLGGGVYLDTGVLAVTRCTFRGNAAEYGAGMYVRESSLHVSDCRFSANQAFTAGGLRIWGSSAFVSGCEFTGNFAHNGGALNIYNSEVTVAGSAFDDNEGEGGGAMIVRTGSVVVTGCRFVGNTAQMAGAIMTTYGAEAAFEDCLFSHSQSNFAVGAVSATGPTTLVNCAFVRNSTGQLGGGLVVADSATLVNCLFSKCEGGRGGGVYVGADSTLVNCTIADSTGSGVMVLDGVTAQLSNCILWGNSHGQIVEDPEEPGAVVVVRNSDVQDGWPGAGNIDADPLFVQPGTDDLRLAFGSPCVNAGRNSAVPPGVTTDLAGNPRIQDGVVDMGAYEGEFDAMPPAQAADDLDQGERVALVPGGGWPDPLENAFVIAKNTSGPDNGTFVVTQYTNDLHPGAGGYSAAGDVLRNETSLADGEHLTTLYLPFGAGDIGRADPLHVDVTWFDPAAGNWSLAVAANTAPSPGFGGPIGDRITAQGDDSWGLTRELGDYGVYWDPAAQQGFAWAYVDHAGDFGLGVALCPADCRQTPDGRVSVMDLLAMLAAWGAAAGGGPCDVDMNGVVDRDDLQALVGTWGRCPQRSIWGGGARGGARPVAASTARRLAWADRDGDGVVSARELMRLMSRWRAGGKRR